MTVPTTTRPAVRDMAAGSAPAPGDGAGPSGCPGAARAGRARRRMSRGATAIEYGLIAALTTVVMLAGLGQFSNSAVGMYTNLTNRIVSAGR